MELRALTSRPAPLTLALLVAALGVALAAPARADAAACPPGTVGQVKIRASHEFVATRADNGFGAEVGGTEDTVMTDSIKATADPPASVRQLDTGGLVLDAPNPGPVTINVTWDQRPASAPICSASGTAVVTVVPVRLPVVRDQPIGRPLAVGPTVTWPCPDAERATDAPSTIVLRWEKGLKKAPGASSPSLRMELDGPCEERLTRAVSTRGSPKLSAADAYSFDPTRFGAVVHAKGTGDLRLVLEIAWGSHKAFHGEYAMVFAGRRKGDKDPVFMTTTPARAQAFARRYARQRKGVPFTSPSELDVRGGRNYTLSVSGSYTVSWTAGRGMPSEPGCGYVREAGSDRTKFTIRAGEDRVRGTTERTYVPTLECAPMPKLGGPSGLDCPARSTLSGQGKVDLHSRGAYLWDARRTRGPWMTLFLFLDWGGDSCPGWEGIFSAPQLILDGSAAGLSKIKVGGRKIMRVTQKTSCVDQVAGTQGDATSCTLSATANVVVRRTS